jgi:hypothetical protein
MKGKFISEELLELLLDYAKRDIYADKSFNSVNDAKELVRAVEFIEWVEYEK